MNKRIETENKRQELNGACSMRLDQADLCVDCDLVFDARRRQTCPACGSAQVVPLAKWVMPIGRIVIKIKTEDMHFVPEEAAWP